MARAPLRPSLPQSLLDQIDETNGRNRGKGPRNKISRKDARKQERVDRKQRRANFFIGGAKTDVNTGKRRADHEHSDSPKRKKAKTNSVPDSILVPTKAFSSSKQPSISVPTKASSSSKQPDVKPRTKLQVKPKKTALEKLTSRSTSGPLLAPRSQREKEDDAYISYLEGKLGHSGKAKGKKKAEDDDGLDDLFDFTSSILPTVHEPSESEQSIDGEEGSEYTSEEDDDDKDGWDGIQSNSQDSDEAPILLSVPPGREDVTAKETSSTSTRYIPPHLRDRPTTTTSEDSEAQVKLKRQLKGLLNRLSEQNLAGILDSIEEVYRGHRRHDVSSTLTTLIVDSISSHSILLDSYVVLYAAFVSSLHKIIGIEFAAYFVQNVVSFYTSHLKVLSDAPSSKPELEPQEKGKGKEASNLIVLLSELYNFQVISSILVFDLIRDLLERPLEEFGVELLLKVVRNSGQQLRADDPSALKDIIAIVQTKLSSQDTALTSRTRFMIETLTNLKNNKLKRTAAGQVHQGGEAVERCKKFLTGLSKKRHLQANEPLRVSLSDLQAASTKGKWWLVGAAWAGDPLAERQEANKSNPTAAAKEDAITNENALLKLARKQGMNTDIRRSVFVVIMSSDDYVDACERLSQLNLSEVQQREIVRVILHCCGNEKSYNPYYTLIASHLSRTSHSYKVTIQFCLWDFLRDLGEKSVGGKNMNLDDDDGFETKSISKTRIENVAKAYGWWVAKDSASLAILKPVDFTQLKSTTKSFLRQFLIQTLISTQVSTPALTNNTLSSSRNRGAIEEVFIKATRIEGLALGLVYFLSKEMMARGDNDSEGGFVEWAIGIALGTLRVGMDVIPDL